jgi:FixJ family two-component response regulator
MDDFLTKPIEKEKLEAVLNKYLKNSSEPYEKKHSHGNGFRHKSNGNSK